MINKLTVTDAKPPYLHGFGWGRDYYEFEWKPSSVEKVES